MLVVAGCCLHGAHVYSKATYTSLAQPRALFLWNSRWFALGFLSAFFSVDLFHRVLFLSLFPFAFSYLVPHRSWLCVSKFSFPKKITFTFFLNEGWQSHVVYISARKIKKKHNNVRPMKEMRFIQFPLLMKAVMDWLPVSRCTAGLKKSCFCNVFFHTVPAVWAASQKVPESLRSCAA